MVNPGKVRKRILYIYPPLCTVGDAQAIHSHYRRALGSRAPSVAMLDDGGGAQRGGSSTHGFEALCAGAPRMHSRGPLLLLCRLLYYCTGESRIPSEFGLTMPGGMGWPPYRLCPLQFKDRINIAFDSYNE